MKYRISIIFVAFMLASCTSVSLNRNEIMREFGDRTFKLANPMYLALYLNCSFFRGVYEDEVARIKFVDKIMSDNAARFERYKHIKVGDKNCAPSNDIRVYKLLSPGQEVEIDSIVDVLNASWWFWNLKGTILVDGETIAFEIDLPYEKNKTLRNSLSEVFMLD